MTKIDQKYVSDLENESITLHEAVVELKKQLKLLEVNVLKRLKSSFDEGFNYALQTFKEVTDDS